MQECFVWLKELLIAMNDGAIAHNIHRMKKIKKFI